MRRQLLISMLAVAVAAVLALGIPLAFVLARLQVQQANRALHADAQRVAEDLFQRNEGQLPVNASFAAELGRALAGRYVVIRNNGQMLAKTGPPPAKHDFRSATVAAGPQGKQYEVTVEADDSYLSGNLTKELLLVGGVALAAVGVAVVLGLLYSRRITRPLQELAGAADRLGSGDTGPLGRRYGIQELDRVAEGLDGSAQRINDLLSAERDFAVDASHQLRTPLTALSMRLEEMMAAADYPEVVREEGAAALAQTERLAEVVSQLLGRARRTSAGVPTVASVDDIVGQQVLEWEPAFPAARSPAGGGRGEGPICVRDPGRSCPGRRHAAGQRPGARSGHRHDPDFTHAAVRGGRGARRGRRRAVGACAEDFRAQRQRVAEWHRSRARTGSNHRGRRRRPGRARAAPAGRVRSFPAACDGRCRGAAGGTRAGLASARARPARVPALGLRGVPRLGGGRLALPPRATLAVSYGG